MTNWPKSIVSWWRRRAHKRCKHQWVQEGAKRHCAKCPAEEWLFWNRYPAIGEPAHEWRDMTLPGRFL
jgi:hypothetical protein